MNSEQNIRIVEVGARDGLQNISRRLPTETKIELIKALHNTGLKCVEATSIVSPKSVPQLADCREVLQSPLAQELLRDASVRLPVLVPNLKGLNIARQIGVSEVAVFVSATEGFSKTNINCTVDIGLHRAREVVKEATKHEVVVRGYVSCIFADPFDGPTPTEAVLKVVRELLAMGCYEVSLGDTLGVGSPSDVRRLLKSLADNGVPLGQLAGHFHDTYGQALANVWEGYRCGLRVFDSSVAGLGGCPFAPGAKGNAATEDLVYMFNRAGISTGVNLDKLVTVAAWISRKLSQRIGSRVGAALTSKNKEGASSDCEGSKLQDETRLLWEETQQTDGLLVHRSGANLKITLNKPRNGNALTAAMIHDLISVFSQAEKDQTISRIAIVGSGKFFCTGMDLGKGTSPVNTEGASSGDQYERLTRLFEVVDQSPKVTISCMNGPAFGGGVGLALACDLRLCTGNASVTLSEAKLGLCPATISKYVIREMGVPFAREAMLTVRPVLASEMKSRGIAAHVVDEPAKLPAFLDSFLTGLRVASSDASRMCKDLVHAAWSDGGRNQNEAIRQLFGEMMGPDAPGRFGVAEFQAKRPVDWDNYYDNERDSKL